MMSLKSLLVATTALFAKPDELAKFPEITVEILKTELEQAKLPENKGKKGIYKVLFDAINKGTTDGSGNTIDGKVVDCVIQISSTLVRPGVNSRWELIFRIYWMKLVDYNNLTKYDKRNLECSYYWTDGRTAFSLNHTGWCKKYWHCTRVDVFSKDHPIDQFPGIIGPNPYTFKPVTDSDYIPKLAYSDMNFIKDLILSPRTNIIDEYAFQDCSAMTSATIPDKVKFLGAGSFYGCSKLISVTIEGPISILNNITFQYCTELKRVEIPISVISIGHSAFFCCHSLKNFKIPDRVTSIGYEAFRGCTSLELVKIPEGVKNISSAAYKQCGALIRMKLPTNLVSIEEEAFCKCKSLMNITIPDRVTSIGARAFFGCISLGTVTISDSVTSIGEGAFDECSSLVTLLVQSVGGATAGASQDNANMWNKILFAKTLKTHKIWAPDHVIVQLGGPFEDYTTLAEVPDKMKVFPKDTTYATGALQLWWSDPDIDVGNRRVLSRSRKQMVWTVMHSAYKSSEVLELLPVLEPELWMLVFTFVKNEQPPM